MPKINCYLIKNIPTMIKATPNNFRPLTPALIIKIEYKKEIITPIETATVSASGVAIKP